MVTFDVAVVGLGALGSAAAYHAAARGVKVIGFEQFEFGHVRGASHDTSRIFRTSNPLPEQVALARSALEDWRKLEAQCGQELLTITGGLVFFPRDQASDGQGLNDFVKSLKAEDMPYELLSSQDVMARWPNFNLAPDNVDAVYTKDTGIIHASKSVTAMQFVARFNGAILKEKTTVERIVPSSDGGEISIHTSKGQFHAKKVILATDAWSNKLLEPLNAQVPLTIMQEQVTYFKPEDATGFTPDQFPVWIWFGEKSFYGFPAYGEPTIKVAEDASGNTTTLESRTFAVSPKLLSELTNFTQALIPAKGGISRTITCQYTIPPKRQLIMSPLNKHRNVILGMGAALGFKYAPAIGRVLAELAIYGKSTEDIVNFAVPRSVGDSKL